MQILGNRVLVSQVEEEKKEGEFSTVEIQDSFLYKGKVEQVGGENIPVEYKGSTYYSPGFKVGDIIYFAKYSPHTQEIEGMKVLRLEDIIAVV